MNMSSEAPPVLALPGPTAQRPLIAFALVAAVLAAAILVYLPTALSMAQIWSRSQTFAHGWLVLPASLWFVWQRRAQLAALPLAPWWPGALLVAGAGALWLAAELAGVLSAAQFALVALAACAVIAATGLAWARALAFPLAFLLFAVPFGEIFVPTLIDWTADFTVAALKLSGVPVYREGNEFAIPSGRWSVVEACSGVRYLLASAMAGTLYAWLMYRSARRRALFVAASLLVPIVANWLRAYLIVMLGHLSDNRIAAGVDHLIYGWIFFGIVMLAMFAAGARWREDDCPPATRARCPAASGRPPPALVPAWLALAALLALWPLLALALLAQADRRRVLAAQVQPGAGWSEATADNGWRPELQAPRALAQQHFARGASRVALHVGYFRAQTQASELVSSRNAVASEDGPWRLLARGRTMAALGATPIVWRTAIVRGADGRQVAVWQTYWLGERWSASAVRAKVELAVDRLLARSDTSAWVALAVAHDPDHPQQSQAALREFLTQMGPSLQRALQETAAR